MTARRIGLVTTSFPAFAGDPAGHFVRTEADELASTGALVTVIAPRPRSLRPDPRASRREQQPRMRWIAGGTAFGWPGALARLRENPLRAFSALTFCRLAQRELERCGPFDDLIAHWLVPSAWPIASAVRGRLEIVVHGSDVRVLERLPRFVGAELVKRLMARDAAFRFVSHELLERLVRLTAVDVTARSRVAPSPITVPPSLNRRMARALLGIPESQRVAVIVGRLVRGKRTEVAIEWARRRAERVVVIGDGPERRRLASEGAALLGRLSHPETLEWIAAADLLVSASREEGAPTAIREARTLGVPVLTASCGDVRAWAEADPGIEILDVD